MTGNRNGSRRLLRLRLGIVVLGGILAARVVHVQIIEHDRWRTFGDGQWEREISLDAERGNLYDRHGRPLALSVTTYDVGIHKDYFQDPAAVTRALGDVLNCDPARLQRRIDASPRKYVHLAGEVTLDEAEYERLKGLQVCLDPRCSRYYPADGVGAALIGRYRQDPEQDLSTGLESGLGTYLDGSPGRAREIRTADAARNMGQVVLERARHGNSLVLTLDIEMQGICETELAAAIESTGAKGGSILVVDPANGDVLAAASWPLMDTRARSHSDAAEWNNRIFTENFEPGSVFKPFSFASLLRNGAIDTATVYNCDGVYRGIHNDRNHDYGDLSMLAALSRSANIYPAKASENLCDDELFRDLVTFGFGQKTGVPYPGEGNGILHPLPDWSDRSRRTICIGQEVAVTSLQLGMALAAVANGGLLYAPRIVKEIREFGGGAVEVVQPVRLRRVMAPPLAELLRQAMGRVVEQGTGQAAQLGWVRAAGKTGTAQKSRDGRGYTPGAYVTSFGGMVPQEDPRLVILAMLDEPDRTHHYAASSTAPLFRSVVREIRRCTSWLSDLPDGAAKVVVPDPDRFVRVPDVMYLSVEHAMGRLAAAGLTTAGAEREGLVIEQVPAAGARYLRGRSVTLTVADPDPAPPAQASLVPDFVGLSNRQVASLATRLGIDVRIEGVGYARTQDVSSGRAAGNRPVTVKMAAAWH